MNLIKKVLCNGLMELDWWKSLFGIFATIIICAVTPFSFTLIPLHNVILQPGYWYEIPLQFTNLTILIGLVLPYIIGKFLNIGRINSFRYLLAGSVVATVVMYLAVVTIFFIWTHALELRFPMPFLFPIMVNSSVFATATFVWFSFPHDWRMNHGFRRRLKFLPLYFVYDAITNILYKIASQLLRANQNEYQPVIALLFIVIREVDSVFARKLISKLASGDQSQAQATGMLGVGIRYEMSVCYILGDTIASNETEIVLMGLDFIYNIYLTLQITRLKKRAPEDTEKQINLIEELALNEILEFTAPLAFIFGFLLAYFGPNATLIGNVGARIGAYEPIEDIIGFLQTLSLFFLVDFCSTIISSVILWLYCRINFFAVLMVFQKEYGVNLCILMASANMAVSIQLSK